MGLKRYQRLRKAKKSYCEGRISKTALNIQENAYVVYRMKQGDTKTEARKKAKKITGAKCSLASKPKGKNRTKKRTAKA